MDLRSFCLKKFYRLQQEVDSLSERDKMLALGLAVIILLALWFFAFFNLQRISLNKINQQIDLLHSQLDPLTNKSILIESLVKNPDIERLMIRFHELKGKMKVLDEELVSYGEHYIKNQELAKLLHDMVQQTLGVSIVDFTTFIPQISNSPTQAADTKSLTNLFVQSIHYRLVLRGNYFSIMNYLARLEKLPWTLYWDKFDYSVSKYPEGIATIEFYTLKPEAIEESVKRGVRE